MCRYELTHSKYVDKLSAGKHSTKGLGRTAPTTDGHKTTEEGVVIPMGKGSSTAVDNTSLLYNEYPIHCRCVWVCVCGCVWACVCVYCYTHLVLLIHAVIALCPLNVYFEWVCFVSSFVCYLDPNFRFIVYDVSQIRIKYLLKMNFKYKC